MTDLSTVKNRDNLKPRREPYWQRLAVGQYLGYRPSATGTGGSWIARQYDSDARKQRPHALGDFGHLPPNERFTAASAEAREWFKFISGGGSHELVTVRDACEQYAAARPDAAKRFHRYVYNHPIAKAKLRKVTDRQIAEWRKHLEAMPALVTRSKQGEQVTRIRAAATVNRDMVPFRAALNLAGVPNTVWKKAMEPAEAFGRREIYLDREQRRELLKHIAPEVETFVRGLCLLPFRPGALAKLVVGDFDARQQTLTIGRDKVKSGRRISLPDDVALLLKEQCRLKLPAAPIFHRADGQGWTKDAWKGPIKKAVLASGLPKAATAYSLRHSTITDLVQAGIPLLTVAQLSGTSVRMIERHYGHLQQEHAIRALASLAL